MKAEGRIAFTSERDGDYEIYVVNVDGSGIENLTKNPAKDSEPTWSPDGKQIAFISDRDHEFGEIYVMDATGTNIRRLTTAEDGTTRSPAWAPTGETIAFLQGIGGGNTLQLMKTDGSGHVEITTDRVDGYSWSPDGKLFAFQTDDLYVSKTDGSAVTKVASPKEFAFYPFPTWSPDSTRLAFGDGIHVNIGSDPTPPQIWVVNADGSGLKNISSNSSTEMLPAWSPSGNRIAFSSDRDEEYSEIYLIDPDGSNVVRLTNNKATDTIAVWSPDGLRIAFLSDRDGQFEIYVMNADGSDQVRLTTDSGVKGVPVWLPAH